MACCLPGIRLAGISPEPMSSCSAVRTFFFTTACNAESRDISHPY
ncbi:MAG: hypothetical protein OFPI_13160 [Osedax symbiont Rs2]|nr:MAG: hypothetical protein OFPI_13160 [Osedax symbiont Rs2]